MHSSLLLLIILASFPAVWGTDYTVSTYAGMGAPDFADGSGDTAKFYNPADVAVDSAGNVYVADTDNSRVRIIKPDRTVSTLAGGPPGFGEEAKLYNPLGLDVGPGGTIYVADTGNHRIKSIGPDGKVTPLAGGFEGYTEGVGTKASFRKPRDVVASGGVLYVADTGNNRIRRIDQDTVVSTLAGDSAPGYADGQGKAARFFNPQSVALDSAGNIYVADTGNHKIRRITPDGTVTTIAGSWRGYADGPAEEAKFDNPGGLALDSAGNIYVADTGNHKIRRITPDGTVTTIAGSAPIAVSLGYVDGTAEEAKFNRPSGIAVDSAGNIYVVDTGNQRVRKISPTAPPKPAMTAPPATQPRAGTSPAPPQTTTAAGSTLPPSKGACGPTSVLLLALLPALAFNPLRRGGR
ncbi:MAG: SMP-30/gluconolactonase/LRE family protein [Candidatus Hydrothermarchaeota archaeon]